MVLQPPLDDALFQGGNVAHEKEGIEHCSKETIRTVVPKSCCSGQRSIGLTLHSENFYDSFLSKSAKERIPGPIHSILPLERRPGLISLLAGKPNPSTFPFTSISFTARSPIDPSTECSYNITGQSLATALQYSSVPGITTLIDWISGLQEYTHGRKKTEDWKVSIGVASQDLLYKAFNALVNDGDPVLIETPVYAGALPILRSLHANLIEVESDVDGLSAESLQNVLDQWPSDKPKPRLLYTIPYGCNPTGRTTTLERRLEVLRIVRKHNIIILEDDPYYYLYYGSRIRPPSYFSLEAQDGGPTGIILRLDSFSVVLGGGLRIGSVTGPRPLVHAIDSHTSNFNLQPPSFTQVLVHTLVSAWGYEGFHKHADHLCNLYRTKRDAFEAAMRHHLGDLADWIAPDAGNFFWIKLRLPPSADRENGGSEPLVWTNTSEHGISAVPGMAFFPNGAKSAYIRMSFDLSDESEMNEALAEVARVTKHAQEGHVTTMLV